MKDASDQWRYGRIVSLAPAAGAPVDEPAIRSARRTATTMSSTPTWVGDERARRGAARPADFSWNLAAKPEWLSKYSLRLRKIPRLGEPSPPRATAAVTR
jgi:hypothetical protein